MPRWGDGTLWGEAVWGEEIYVKLRTAFDKINNLLAASGLFPGGVQIGEPKKAPGNTAAAIIMGNGSVEELRYGTATMDRREIIIRIYINVTLGDNARAELVEFLLDDMWDDLKPILISGLNLGLTGVYCSDPASITYSCGYVEVDQTAFRLMDISIPMTIDDTATVA